jgi:hypothetical protein
MIEALAPLLKRKADALLIFTGLLLVIVSVYFVWSMSYVSKTSFLPSGKITQCEGICKYKGADDFFWLNAAADLSVFDKSLVYTPNSSTASVQLNSGSKLILYPNSLVQITNTKKGVVIDIIEGKINFEKVGKSTGERVLLKGKELDLAQFVEGSPLELTAIPELLKVSIPQMVYFRNTPAKVKVDILNGSGPFTVYLEGWENESKIKSDANSFLFEVRQPGIYNLKILDSKEQVSTKFLTVVDLSVPQVVSPTEGDIIYSKSFMPNINSDMNETEVSLVRQQKEVFRGKLNRMPESLMPGEYQLTARRVKQSEFGEWSPAVSFQLVDSKRPILDTKNQGIFFDQVDLRWKKKLPVLHLLRIKNSNNSDDVKITTQSDSFSFTPQLTGKYSWSLTPLLEGDEEKTEERDFTVIKLSQIQKSPEENEQIVSESMREQITFSWDNFLIEKLPMFLEVSDQGKKWSFEVTGKTYLKLSLDTLEKYKWKLIIGSDSLSTPKKAFEISAPAPMPAISGEELIFKDSK